MEEDEVLSKITRLLERGCTMLATHHDCGAPLFRCQGEIVCPVCSFQDEQVHGEQLSGAGKEVPEPLGSEGEEPDHEPVAPLLQVAGNGIPLGSRNTDPFAGERWDGGLMEVKAGLRASLIARLDELSGGIRSEQDLDRLKKMLDCAEGLLRVLRSM
ncbi:MAG: Sjogren's syndrome/scleroderma autoantigen 1 family protein [Methanothrix sp.]